MGSSRKRSQSQPPSDRPQSKQECTATDPDREHQPADQSSSPQLPATEEESEEEEQLFTFLVQFGGKKKYRFSCPNSSLSPDHMLTAARGIFWNVLPEGPLVILDSAGLKPMNCFPGFVYQIIKKAMLADTFRVLSGRIVDVAGTMSISLYDRYPNDDDCRRAFSLVRWLVVHSTVFVAHQISEVTDLLGDVDQEVFSEEADLPTATDLNEFSVKFNALFAQGDLAPLSFTNENPDTIMLSVALCLRKLSLFDYCDTAKCESQFHQLWAHIMDALLVANATSLSLVWEFDIKVTIPGYQAKHYTDLALLLYTKHGRFPILLMELAGSRLLLTEDHKDFQKLVADMAFILLFQLDMFRGLSVDILQHFRIFGVLANRFSFDLLCLQPVLEEDEHGRRSISFLLQYDRSRRKALVPGIESLADSDRPNRQVQFAALSGDDIDEVRAKVIEEDINREREEDDDLVPGLAARIKSKPRTNDDNIESLRPLVAFCNRVRKYAQTTKAVLDDATPATPSGYVQRFPKAPSSRTSGHGRTPSDQRRLGPQSGPFTRSGTIPAYGGGQLPSSSDAAGSRLVDAIGGYDVDVLSRDQDKTVAAFSLDNGRRRVISCSRRPSSSTDLDMCRRLTDDRYVPKVFGSGELDHGVSYLIFEELSVGLPSPRDVEQLFYIMIKLFRDILMALDYFRQQRIVHRDISDSNIMYSRDDSRWKIIDLELAVHLPEGDDVFVDDCVVGTAGFIAPEVTSSKTYSFSSDIWSFGMVSLRKMTDEIGIRDGEFRNDRRLRSVFDALVLFSMSLMNQNPSLRPSPADAIRSLTCIEQDLNQVHLQPCPMA